MTGLVPGTSAQDTPHRYVPWFRAVALCIQVILRQIVTPGKLIVLGLLCTATVGIGVMMSASADGVSPVERLEGGLVFTDLFGLAIMLPIVSLVFASGALGDLQEDGTLVYLWLRPMDRSSVVVSAAASAVIASLPLALIPTLVGGLLVANRVAGFDDVVSGGLIAVVFGTPAYASMFVLLGLVVKRSIQWGIFYVLMWEGLAARIGDFAALWTVNGYTRSIMINMVDSDVSIRADFTGFTTVSAVVVLLLVTVVSLVLASVRLGLMDVQ